MNVLLLNNNRTIRRNVNVLFFNYLQSLRQNDIYPSICSMVFKTCWLFYYIIAANLTSKQRYAQVILLWAVFHRCKSLKRKASIIVSTLNMQVHWSDSELMRFISPTSSSILFQRAVHLVPPAKCPLIWHLYRGIIVIGLPKMVHGIRS